MDRTTLGLQKVPAGESIFDGFTTQDRDTIDFLLRLGAQMHKHDAHAALPAPSVEPYIVIAGTGGTIPAGTSVFTAVTALDALGGETVVGPVGSALAPDPLGDVPGVPTAVVDYTAGTLPPNTYYYVVTVTDDAGGESEASDPVQAVVVPGNPNGRVVLSGLTAIAGSGSGWRIYRSTNGGELGLLGQDVAAVDTFTDDGAPCLDPQLQPPVVNTSGGTAKATITVPIGSLPADAVGFRLYASPLPTLDDPSLIGTYALADVDTPIEVPTLGLQPGSPPAASTALAGAAKITLADLAADVTAAIAAGGGGGGGTGPLVLGDSIEWKDADALTSISLQGLEEQTPFEVLHDFHAGDTNPDDSRFTIGEPPNDFGGLPSYLRPIAGIAEVGYEANVINTTIQGERSLEATFQLQDDAGWDRVGVSYIGGAFGVIAVLDRASGQFRLISRNVSTETVEDSAAYVIAGETWVTIRLDRPDPAVSNVYTAELHVGKATIATLTFTLTGSGEIGSQATPVPRWTASWADPGSWGLDRVYSVEHKMVRKLLIGLAEPGQGIIPTLLIDSSGKSDEFLRPWQWQQSGRVNADGTHTGGGGGLVDHVAATGVYKVHFGQGSMVNAPVVMLMDGGAGGVVSGESVDGFTVTFAAETAFNWVAVV